MFCHPSGVKPSHFSFLPCLISVHVDIVLIFCQVKTSTPQSWSVLWWKMMKFKYTYLSVDFHISPSKMACGSHDPEGASGNYKSAHQNGHQDTLNSDFLMSLFLAWQWPSSEEVASSITEMPAPPPLTALKLLLFDARDPSPSISSYPNRAHGPLKDQNVLEAFLSFILQPFWLFCIKGSQIPSKGLSQGAQALLSYCNWSKCCPN